MTNYPPGVYGGEPQIAGPGREQTEQRSCDHEDIKAVLLSKNARMDLAALVGMLGEADDAGTLGPLTIKNALAYARRIQRGALDLDVEGTCPFDGPVNVSSTYSHGVLTERWTCPVCGGEHESQLDRSDFEV